jgi:hypothetical protein
MKEGSIIAIDSKGPEVKKLQEWLQELQYPVGLVDGFFGSQTEKAVKLFQRQHGLLADGIVGEKTRLALEEALRGKDFSQKDRIPDNSLDLTKFELEPHVKEAFRIAWALSEGKPINARHSLYAALILSDSIPTGAFPKLADLLPIKELDQPKTEQVSSLDLRAVPLVSPLAKSFSIAEPFLKQKGVWGRDYITIALLAVNDPSLEKIAKEAGSSLKAIQKEWFRYVTLDERHRDRPSWEKWWHDAGVPPPEPIGQKTDQEETGKQPTQDTLYIAPRAWVETDSIPTISDHDYRPSKLDSLDMKDRAHIFATLLIAKDIKPPFALGLLGDWGVGKTFFMRLMIEKVASIAGKNAAAGQMSDSVSRAAQIEFNAWHYVDSDLWASLASRIYDGLSRELCLREEKVEQTRRTLRQRITSSQQEKGEASAALEGRRKSGRKPPKS